MKAAAVRLHMRRRRRARGELRNITMNVASTAWGRCWYVARPPKRRDHQSGQKCCTARLSRAKHCSVGCRPRQSTVQPSCT
eukprot:7452711-Pyramimonas_sp.AAC.2